jgi:hypothetical protein
MIKLKEKENIYILMAHHIMEIGMKINSMVMEWKLGLMGLVIKDFTIMEKNKELDNLNGQMVLLIKEISKRIIFMVKESIIGLMVENLLEIGKIEKWMERENILGQMEENTLESM